MAHFLLFASVLVGLSAAAAAVEPELRSDVSQHGITWTFDKPCRVGRFVNGDWWVVGPVQITSITPAPGPAPESESTVADPNQFGDTSLQSDNRMRNGSAIILKAGNRGQGYDSRSRNFDPSMTVRAPLTLEVSRSLVSTISNPSSALPIVMFFRGSSDKSMSLLKTAAVLTCLEAAPPADAFRPCYAGTEKAIYREGSLRRDLLLNLARVEGMPDYAQYARYFQRVWLDDQQTWLAEPTYPVENCPNYGREHARLGSIASLMLLSDAPAAEKEPLLTGFVQLGIDLYGLSQIGGTWPGEGGIWNGRKWPIVFAGIMLGDEQMQRIPGRAIFTEDQQTYYGKGFFGQTVLWQMGVHHAKAAPYEEKDPAEWDDMDRRSEGYRICCTGNAWVGEALAARLMKAMAVWNHDAFFDYVDRWMSDEDARIARQGRRRNTSQGRAWDPFVTNMWKAYRDKCPEQPGATRNMKWIWDDGGKWVPNP